MTMLVHLLRLHLSRIFRSMALFGLILVVPLLAGALRLLGTKTSFLTTITVFLVCGAAVTSIQMLLDKESGLAEGLRTTRAAKKHIISSRLVLIPIIVIMQSALYGVVSSIVSAVK